MKRFIAGLLMVLSVFAFMSCSNETPVVKTALTLTSKDSAIATGSATVSSSTTADAYVFVGGAYVSATAADIVGNYGVLSAMRTDSTWTFNYVGAITGTQVFTVYIAEVTGASSLTKEYGEITITAKSVISEEPEPVSYVELEIVSGKEKNTDSEVVEVDIDYDEPNAVGVFVGGLWYGDLDEGGLGTKVTLCDEVGTEVATLDVINNYSGGYGYCLVTLAGMDDHFGTLTDDIITVQLGTYYGSEGLYVIKELLDEFDVKVNVYGATVYRMDNIINTEAIVTTSDCLAYYKDSDGDFVQITEDFSESTPMVGNLGFLTYKYDETKGAGTLTFVQSSTKKIGTASLEVYLGTEVNKTAYGHFTTVVNTLKAVVTPMEPVSGFDIRATYTYKGMLTKAVSDPAVTVYMYDSKDAKWVEWENGADGEEIFFNAAGNAIGYVFYTQAVSGTVEVGVEAFDIGKGSCQLVFGYKTQGDSADFVPTDWLKLTYTF